MYNLRVLKEIKEIEINGFEHYDQGYHDSKLKEVEALIVHQQYSLNVYFFGYENVSLKMINLCFHLNYYSF